VERKGIVTVHGNPLTLVGNEVKAGDKARDCTLTDNDMKPVSLKDYSGKILVLSSVPSLDTPVCDTETRRFNKEAAEFSPDTVMLTISMDLPFAQKRWCGAAGIDRVITLSDYKDASFGMAYGVLIKETRLLARVVFVVDKKGIIRYIQIVKDLTNEPDYGKALEAVKALK
jgi:thiol peroxidase